MSLMPNPFARVSITLSETLQLLAGQRHGRAMACLLPRTIIRRLRLVAITKCRVPGHDRVIGILLPLW